MLLANPDWSDRAIAESCKVSVHTIAAVREREASTIEARKKTRTSVLVDVATLGAEQMERKIGRSSLRDATIATGVSVDKVLALQGQSPVGVQVACLVSTCQVKRRSAHEAAQSIDAEARHASRAQAAASRNGCAGKSRYWFNIVSHWSHPATVAWPCVFRPWITSSTAARLPRFRGHNLSRDEVREPARFEHGYRSVA